MLLGTDENGRTSVEDPVVALGRPALARLGRQPQRNTFLNSSDLRQAKDSPMASNSSLGKASLSREQHRQFLEQVNSQAMMKTSESLEPTQKPYLVSSLAFTSTTKLLRPANEQDGF